MRKHALTVMNLFMNFLLNLSFFWFVESDIVLISSILSQYYCSVKLFKYLGPGVVHNVH